jgi:hypothetical protein
LIFIAEIHLCDKVAMLMLKSGCIWQIGLPQKWFFEGNAVITLWRASMPRVGLLPPAYAHTRLGKRADADVFLQLVYSLAHGFSAAWTSNTQSGKSIKFLHGKMIFLLLYGHHSIVLTSNVSNF